MNLSPYGSMGEVNPSRCYRVLLLPGFRLQRGKEIAPMTMITVLKPQWAVTSIEHEPPETEEIALETAPLPDRSRGCGPLQRLQNSANSLPLGEARDAQQRRNLSGRDHPGMAGEMIPECRGDITECRATPTEPAGEHSTRRLAPP